MTWVLLIVVGLIVAWRLLFFLVAFFETHNIHSYVDEVHSADEISQLKYIEDVREAGRQAGFMDWSYFRHSKWKIVSAVSFSVDRKVFLLTGEGRMAGIPVKQTWLTSCLPDGRQVVTTNYIGSGSADIVKEKVVWEASLDTLLQEHYVSVEGWQVIPFQEATGPEVTAFLATCRADYLYERGILKWLDPQHTRWKLSFKGALRACLRLRKQGAEVIRDVEQVRQQRRNAEE